MSIDLYTFALCTIARFPNKDPQLTTSQAQEDAYYRRCELHLPAALSGVVTGLKWFGRLRLVVADQPTPNPAKS